MKKIFITGVSSGIGNALAEKFLDRGWAVYGISRRTPETLIGRPEFFFDALDLKNVGAIPEAVRNFIPVNTSFDLVVLNAAAVGKIGDVKETGIAEFEELMRLNVLANKAVLDGLFSICPEVKQVVAISSCAATAAFRGTAAYCMSKAALNMLIALYAEEKNKTHFSAIAPGVVQTEMQDQIASDLQSERFPSLAFLKDLRAAGGMLKPEAAAEYFLKIFDIALKQKSGSFIDASRMSFKLRSEPAALCAA